MTRRNKKELLQYIKKDPTFISKCHFAQRVMEDILTATLKE